MIGAGFIGLETAAALAERLHAITVVDLAPSAGTTLHQKSVNSASMPYKELGSEVHFETKVESIDKTDDGLEIALTGGKTLTVDGVLLSVGARPNDDLLVNAGGANIAQLLSTSLSVHRARALCVATWSWHLTCC